jgi:hypothetical protein
MVATACDAGVFAAVSLIDDRLSDGNNFCGDPDAMQSRRDQLKPLSLC